jgi:hypothetical protein
MVTTGKFEWMSKHADTITVMTALFGIVMWMNSQFNQIDRNLAALEKDIAVIKTVLIVKNIMTSEIAAVTEK